MGNHEPIGSQLIGSLIIITFISCRMRSLTILIISIFLVNNLHIPGNKAQSKKENFAGRTQRFWFRLKKREASGHKEDIENIVNESAEIVESSDLLSAANTVKYTSTQRRLKRGPSCKRLLLRSEFFKMWNVPAYKDGACS